MGAGSGSGATRAARQEEEARAERIRLGEQRVNAAFDSPGRTGQIDKLIAALRDRYQLDLGRQQEVASRRTKFANARSGNVGGSVAVDRGRRLGEEFSEGIINAEGRAQQAGMDLRMADEDARNSMLSLVRAGGDATTAAARSAALMRTNAQTAEANSMVNGLGDMFGAATDTYLRAEEASQRRRGMRDAQTSFYAKPFTG